MASTSTPLTITKDSGNDILTTTGWAQMTISLDSQAGGVNKFGFNNSGGLTEFEPGQVKTMIVAPNTKVLVSTTSTAPVKWSIQITDLDFLADIIDALCGLGG